MNIAGGADLESAPFDVKAGSAAIMAQPAARRRNG
ncbi:hypothetical protein HNO92_003125 [Chromobacterium alkanivorans]|nr:hypothetical protein [Chromobacterium alkanivorans]MCS3820036.1 hypothetical protein [Chromobacterium alkanivorans]MCS3874793.1 hypothetical protein [Chromobacterium alkanivorans]